MDFNPFNPLNPRLIGSLESDARFPFMPLVAVVDSQAEFAKGFIVGHSGLPVPVRIVFVGRLMVASGREVLFIFRSDTRGKQRRNSLLHETELVGPEVVTCLR